MSSTLVDIIKGTISGKGKARCDCPVCGHKNTLSISQVGTEIVYCCFSASCGIKGKFNDSISLDSLRSANSSNNFSADDLEHRERQDFSFFHANDLCRNYLSSFNISLDNLDRLNLQYDPKQNRLVFPLEYKGENYGYVGRGLDSNIIPKWFVYLRLMGCPFIVQNGVSNNNQVVLLEDCISAVRGMAFFNCISLLGTNVSDDTLKYLWDYDTICIALDPDALSKSLKLYKQLCVYKPTKILSIDKDIKYFSDDELQNVQSFLHS